MRSRGLGLYVHIPFCVSKCAYCDFVSYPGLDALHGAYVEAVRAEIAASPRTAARTIYFGGGTPTVLGAEALAGLLDALKRRFDVDPGAEITCEANPDTVDEAKLAALRVAGFNRMSLGVQSFEDDVLSSLGRAHDAAAGRRAVVAARGAGFENVSIDLIFGTPGETVASWRRTLREAVALAPDHISAYCLTVEPGTVLAERIAAGDVPAPDEDLAAEMMEAAARTLGANGYEHYEISNFAKEGRRCVHNEECWMYRDYLGFGAGAHSKLNGVRWANSADVAGYARAWTRSLSTRDVCCESTILGLRRLEGMPTESLREAWARLGVDVEPMLASLAGQDLIEVGERVRLSDRGVGLANRVFREFV